MRLRIPPGNRAITVYEGGSDRSFNPDSISDVQRVLEEFLGKNYFMQINRDMGSLFDWTVLVGQQDLQRKDSSFEHAVAVGKDLVVAMLEACIAAKVMDKREL